MAPRKKDKGRAAARKQKRAGKDVLRELYKLCPEAGGEAGVKENGKEMFIRSQKVFSLPESIGTLDGLQILNLSECPQLLELPDTIGGLKALTSLDLSGCESLTALPNAIGELGALTELHLNECSSLTALPVAIGELGALTTLYLRGCSSLAGLPAMIGELKALTYLNLSACSSLTTLPATIGELSALTTLTLYGCSKLAALPAAIGGLGALKQLWLRDCSSLTALPESIGKLGALTRLDLNECSSLTTLPDAIGKLGALMTLNLDGCSSLVELPDAIGELKALTELDLEGCSSLAALPPTIKAIAKLEVKGWEQPLSGYARFLQLARPRIEAMFHDLLITKIIKGSVSEFWDDLSESKRAKLDDPHDGDAHGEILVRNLMKVLRRQKRRICDICSRVRPLEEDRFPVCWCGARRYCGLECQKKDWDAGHSRTCASGYTWSNEDLDAYWTLSGEEAVSDKAMEILRQQTSNTYLLRASIRQYEYEKKRINEEKKLFYAKNPPPADRER